MNKDKIVELNNFGRRCKNNAILEIIEIKGGKMRIFFKNKINIAQSEYFCAKLSNSSNIVKITWSLINSEGGNK